LLRFEPIQARPQSAVTRISRRLWRQRVKVAFGLVAILVLLSAYLAWRYWPERRLILVNQRRVTSDPGLTTQPSLSPDGKLLAYASDRAGKGDLDIWLQTRGDGKSRQITFHEADDHEPALSGDGKLIAFRSERSGGGIYLISTQGEEERKLADKGRHPRFSPDGSSVAYWTGDEGRGGTNVPLQKTYTIPVQGGEARQVAEHFFSAGLHLAGSHNPFLLRFRTLNRVFL